MLVLCACEESQACCMAFRARGHEAYSCDLEPCSGKHPEWHIQGDCLPLMEGGRFQTMDGTEHAVDAWDLILAFPPCTHLAVSGAKWFAEKRADGRQQAAIDFFLVFTRLSCPKIAIENPVGIMSTYYRKPDQIIQPWQFGHPEQKKTCLWLKGLPPLEETENVKEIMDKLPKCKRERNHYMSPGPERAKNRSKTYLGIAAAMANQWGGKV